MLTFPYCKALFPGLGMDFYVYSLILLTISTTGGAINFIVTIFRLRAPGMTVSRMPLFLYSTLTVSILGRTLDAGTNGGLRAAGTGPAVGISFLRSEPRRTSCCLWQQLFWFFGHPWVYIIFLPATGMISMIIPVFTRRPIVGYPYVAVSTVMTGVVGFGVWVHHMFATGMSTMSMSFFSAASMTISIFSAVQVFAWIATFWNGRPVFTAAFHFAMGFLAVFIIGGLNGIVTAVVPFDWQLTDTYFVVAHIHYVLVGANMLPVFAGFYYWYPKMTGRMLSETLGKVSFWWIFIGLNMAFFPDAHPGADGHAAPAVDIRWRPWLGNYEHGGNRRRVHPWRSGFCSPSSTSSRAHAAARWRETIRGRPTPWSGRPHRRLRLTDRSTFPRCDRAIRSGTSTMKRRIRTASAILDQGRLTLSSRPLDAMPDVYHAHA